MKKLVFMFAAVVAMSFASCDGTTDANTSTVDSDSIAAAQAAAAAQDSDSIAPADSAAAPADSAAAQK